MVLQFAYYYGNCTHAKACYNSGLAQAELLAGGAALQTTSLFATPKKLRSNFFCNESCMATPGPSADGAKKFYSHENELGHPSNRTEQMEKYMATPVLSTDGSQKIPVT